MNKSKRHSLLVNAESFGFGPSSAVADCFPGLREKFNHLSYVGSSHTLDLQIGLPYNEIHRLEGSRSQVDEEFKTIVKEYDGFFTALDFHLADLAIEMGVPCVIYDPLTWFWRRVPSVLSHSKVLYLAQGFHGVKDTIEKQRESFGHVRVVPPLIQRSQLTHDRTLIMVNLGGLMNPFWSLSDCVHYADTLIEAVSAVFKDRRDEVLVLGNKHLEKALPHHKIVTGSRERTKEILSRTKLAISTPGLGNIYESAAHNIPTLFLPPPGDSHGQQLRMLIEHDEADEFIDWHHLDDSMHVDYYADQNSVMQKIANNIKELSFSKNFQNKLYRLVQEKCRLLLEQQSSKASRLLDQFGENGTTEVTQLASNFIQSKEKALKWML